MHVFILFVAFTDVSIVFDSIVPLFALPKHIVKYVHLIILSLLENIIITRRNIKLI